MKITIPTPCHQDWDKMSASDRGRFCGSCKKEVHDFTGKSDMQVITTVTQAEGEVCGRIGSDQLQRINQRTIPLLARQAAMLAIISSTGLTFMTGTAAAQNGMEVQVRNQQADQCIKITGVVTASDSGRALAGVSVAISVDGKDKYLAFTDSKGTFELDILKEERSTLGLLVLSAEPEKYPDTHMDNLPWNDQHLDVRMDEALITGGLPDMIGELPEMTVSGEKPARELISMTVGNMEMITTHVEPQPFGIWRGPRYVETPQERKETITGLIIDEETREPIPFVSAILWDGDSMLTGAVTDFDGKFEFAVPANCSDKAHLKISTIGYEDEKIDNVLFSKKELVLLKMKPAMMMGLYITVIADGESENEPGEFPIVVDGINLIIK